MKKEIKNILKKHIIDYEGMRPMHFYLDHFVAKAWSNMINEAGLDVGIITISKDYLSRFYLFFKDDSIFKTYLCKILKEGNFLKNLKRSILKSKNKIVNELEKTDYNSLSQKELVKFTNNYFKLTNNVYKMAVYLRCIDRGTKIILDKLDNKKDIEKLISESVNPSHSLKENRELVELGIKIKKESLDLDSKYVKNKLKEIHDKYCWITCGNYKEEPRRIEDYENELKDLMASEVSLEDRGLKKLKNKKEAVESLNDFQGSLVNLIIESIYLKDEFKFFVNEILFKSRKLFEELSIRTKKSVDSIKDLSPKEIITLLNNKKINKRNGDEYILIGYNNKIILIEDIEEFSRKYIKLEINNKELKGRSASKGIGKGIVKVILGQRDFSKFEKNNIIVTSNTTPDYVPIIKKASAIIAEEGGLTAHVSIVSREFGIPCIVGVANVTKLLNDGDLVEVNANKGTIRKLK